jgi:hypothetical protein
MRKFCPRLAGLGSNLRDAGKLLKMNAISKTPARKLNTYKVSRRFLVRVAGPAIVRGAGGPGCRACPLTHALR